MIPQYQSWTVISLRFSCTLVLSMQFAHDCVTRRWTFLGGRACAVKTKLRGFVLEKKVVDTSAAYFIAVRSDVFLFAHGFFFCFLGAFAKSQKKAIFIFVMSVRPNRTTLLPLHGFYWNFVCNYLSEIKFQVSLKSDKNNGYFRPLFLNCRAAVWYRALASIIPGRERPEETTLCYKIH